MSTNFSFHQKLKIITEKAQLYFSASFSMWMRVHVHKRSWLEVAGWLNENLEGSRASPEAGVCCPIENPAVMTGEGTAWFSNYWSQDPLTLLKMMELLQCFRFCRPNLWTLILLDIRWKRCIDMNTKKTVKDLLTEQFKNNNKNTLHANFKNKNNYQIKSFQ